MRWGRGGGGAAEGGRERNGTATAASGLFGSICGLPDTPPKGGGGPTGKPGGDEMGGGIGTPDPMPDPVMDGGGTSAELELEGGGMFAPPAPAPADAARFKRALRSIFGFLSSAT